MSKFNGLSKEEAISLIGKYLKDQLDLTERQETQRENYDSPSWSQMQADFIGTKRTLRKVIRYINE